MTKLPLSIDNILKGGKATNEKIIYQDDNFIVLKDKKHSKDSYHYTAWALKDIRSLIEIDINIINQLNQIKQILIDKKFIDESAKIFFHFPPNIWRLHLHFVQENHKFLADEYEIHYFNEIINNIKINSNYYLENVVIRSKL